MTAYVRVQSNVIVEVFASQPSLTPELMATIFAAGDDVREGWRLVDGQFVAPAGPTLAEAKAARQDEVVSLYTGKLEAGMAYGGKVLQIDSDSQLLIVAASAQAMALGASFPGLQWRMADDSFLSIASAAAMITMGATAGAHVEALRVRMWFHKDAIAVLPDVDSVAGYDITTGW